MIQTEVTHYKFSKEMSSLSFRLDAQILCIIYRTARVIVFNVEYIYTAGPVLQGREALCLIRKARPSHGRKQQAQNSMTT